MSESPAGDGHGAAQDRIQLTESEFHRLREFVREHTGIALSDAKRELIYARLGRRLRALNLVSFAEYCALIESRPAAELQELTNAITTNLTAFFRENHHFDRLKSEVFPQIERQGGGTRRMRLWSAGCSTGEEAYSMAMIVRESLAHLSGWDVRILATDIDSNVIATAAAGVYRAERLKHVAAQRVERWFQPMTTRPDYLETAAELKTLITFKQLNLFDRWPMKGCFDVIFCRNVIIYFDKDTQRALFDRMAKHQEPGSWLFVGHSENLFNVADHYKAVGHTVYRRLG